MGSVLFADKERVYAPNFESLIGMLASGRVDAIPGGEMVQANEGKLPAGMKKLGDEPILVLENRFRCKHAIHTDAFIAAVNAALGRLD